MEEKEGRLLSIEGWCRSKEGEGVIRSCGNSEEEKAVAVWS